MTTQLIAKCALNKDNLRARKEYGAKELELQLLDSDMSLDEVTEIIDWTLDELKLKITNVHIHLLNRSNSIEDIESFLYCDLGLKCVRLTFAAAQHAAERQGCLVGVVIHKFKANIKDDNEVAFYKNMLVNYKNVIIYIENSSSYVKSMNKHFIVEPDYMHFDYVREVKAKLPDVSDRLWALIDTTHLISEMRLKSKLRKLGIDIEMVDLNKIMSEYSDVIRAVHLAYALGSGFSCTHTNAKMTKHGMPFKGDSSAGIMFENIVYCINNILHKDTKIILEVLELDYTKPINYSEMAFEYIKVSKRLKDVGIDINERRMYPRMHVNVDAKINNNKYAKIRDISINVDEYEKDFYHYTVRIDVDPDMYNTGDIVNLHIDENKIEGCEVIIKRESSLVLKSRDQNTLKYIDLFLGGDDFVFEKIS